MRHTLNQYLELLEKNGIVKSHKISGLKEVGYISYNSSDVCENTLFICKGANFKKEYLINALSDGAICYISDKDMETDSDYIIVSDIRRAIALVANFYYENIWNKLKLVGITGTKGKSTTAYFIKYIIDEYLKSENKPASAIVSSIDTYDGVIEEESHLTTPEAFELHKHFKNAADSGIEYLTMEVSSQGLKYDRVYGIKYNVGCFLNIGVDHISDVEHPNADDYFYSKMLIFDQCENAVVNLDTDRREEVLKAASKCRRVVTFSRVDETADIFAYDIKKSGNDTVFFVRTPEYTTEIELTIPGIFNVENALAAIAVSYIFGIPKKAIYVGLMKARSSGRMEIYSNSDNTVVSIVDYAHNKMSFENLFKSVQSEFPGRKISIVFGCPGGKAYQRRSELGEISGRYADKVYLTEEDPGDEKVSDISAEIAKYVEKEGGEYEIIDDREQAIKKAILDCTGESIVLITGKGNETRQKRGKEYVPCHTDVEYALKYLKEYDVLNNKDYEEKIASANDVLPQLMKLAGKKIVVKLGGSVMENEELTENILECAALLKTVGAKVVIVHGGGKKISAALSGFGIESKFLNGYRITGEQEIEIVEMVLSGYMNKKIVGILSSKNANAVGISGRDGGLFKVEKKLIDGEDIGRVGEITAVNPKIINELLDADYLPVVSPISDKGGLAYNVNADDGAFNLAEAIKADKLIFITDVNGIMIDAKNSKTKVDEINISKAKMLIENGFVGGGMIPKLKNCVTAIENGVDEVSVLNGNVKNNLISHFLSGREHGTTITA